MFDQMSARWTAADYLDPAWRDGLLGPGTMFELVEEDVLGVHHQVFGQRPHSLSEVLTNAAAAYPDRPYLLGPDRTVTFAEAPDSAARFAAVLIEHHGVGRGDRVALAGTVSIEHCLTVWAVTRAGAISATMNPSWTPTEIAIATKLVEPTLLVVDDDVAARLAAAGGTPTPLVTFTELAAAAEVASPIAEPVATDEDDPFVIIYTSGTTGTPKGATLSHRNAIHFSLTAAATSAIHSIIHDVPRSDRTPTVIAASPLFHMSGLLGQLTNSAVWGTTLVVAPAGRWDARVHLELSERHGVTAWSIVPTQLWRLIEHPDLGSFDLSTLEMIGGGGASFPPDLLRRTAEQLPGVALALRVGYGMTETAGSVTLLQPPVPEGRLGSVGPPVAGCEVRILGTDGRAVPDGEIGEISVRTAQVFLGYWGDDAATAAVLDEDRWYRTGDFGRLDAGYLTLESRMRDMIIRGGENVYPIEIENRLVEHPDVDDAAVVGIDHPTLGQEVRAVIVVRDGATVTTEEMRTWTAATLARHKVPAVVDQVDALPRNETGKVLKRQLTDSPG
jgi:acyl-CoA synthetase (AMP-forming)/AMP-acid ligase II